MYCVILSSYLVASEKGKSASITDLLRSNLSVRIFPTMEKSGATFKLLDTNSAYYADWELRCRMLLKQKECLDAILTERPIEEERQKEYDRLNDKALGLITRHISDHALHKVKEYMTSAREMWKRLKEAYENKSMTNRLNILTRMFNLRMNEDNKIEEHYSKLDAIVSELRMAGAKYGEDTELLTAVLLSSMPASYEHAVTAISMTSDTPTYESVRQRLRDHGLALELKANRKSATTPTSATVMTATDESTKKPTGKRNKKKRNPQNRPGFRNSGRGGRGNARFQPYTQFRNDNFWVANNQCSHCKRYGHQT